MATRGSLSHGERGGVRATKHTRAQIVARFGPLSEFILPVHGRDRQNAGATITSERLLIISHA